MRERYAHICRFVQETPWAIIAAKLEAMLEVLEMRIRGERFTDEEIAARIGAASRRTEVRSQGAVAVVPIVGVISQRADLLTESSGGASIERVTKQFRAALADPGVGSIVLDIDSPGGSVFGVEELAAEIFEARERKRIAAVANSLAASAAYWIATAADELVVTPSGEVGSIGVFAVHDDISRMAEMMGVKRTFISAGKYKTEGNPFEPLGEEARAAIQKRVDEYYDLFVKAVARGRGVAQREVREGFGEGRVVGAREAVKLGMADRVETLDQVVTRLAGGRPREGGSRAEAPAAGPDDVELRRRRLRLAEAGAQ